MFLYGVVDFNDCASTRACGTDNIVMIVDASAIVHSDIKYRPTEIASSTAQHIGLFQSS